MTPDLLFPVGYESHAFLLVELDGPHGGGGACFAWAYDGQEPFVLVAVDLTTYLDVAAVTLESRQLRRHEHDGQISHELDEQAFHRALRERLRQHPHSSYGSAAEIGWNPASWPRHWLASVGPAAREQHALGATTSLAALAEHRSSPVTAGRVHAYVREIWGFPDGVRATVDDGTGVLDVWCRSSVTMFGPACDGRYEFEVVTTDDVPHHAQAEAIAVRLLDTET